MTYAILGRREIRAKERTGLSSICARMGGPSSQGGPGLVSMSYSVSGFVLERRKVIRALPWPY
jgi:hypothetical protein